jgi:hypothetical protein
VNSLAARGQQVEARNAHTKQTPPVPAPLNLKMKLTSPCLVSSVLSSKPESSERLSLSDSDPDMLDSTERMRDLVDNLLCFLLLVLLPNLK